MMAMMMIMTSPEIITIEDTNNENHDDNRKPVFVMMIVMGTMGTNVRTTKRHNNDTDNDNFDDNHDDNGDHGNNHGETQDGGELSSRRKTLGGGMGESSMCRSFTAGGIISIISSIVSILYPLRASSSPSSSSLSSGGESASGMSRSFTLETVPEAAEGDTLARCTYFFCSL